MICLHCGHCCLTSLVVVIKDPDKPIQEDNLLGLDGTTRCPHLKGEKPGEYLCAIHEHPAFKETPCWQFTQIERGNQPCRLGKHFTK